MSNVTKRQYIKTTSKLCNLCGRCALVCSRQNTGAMDTSKSAVVVEHDLPNSFKIKLRNCNQCPQEYCVKVCPTGALYRHETGYVALDRAKCNSCDGEFRCVEACKARLIFRHADCEYPLKCTLCDGDPACVKECISDALKLAESERV